MKDPYKAISDTSDRFTIGGIHEAVDDLGKSLKKTKQSYFVSFLLILIIFLFLIWQYFNPNSTSKITGNLSELGLNNETIEFIKGSSQEGTETIDDVFGKKILKILEQLDAKVSKIKTQPESVDVDLSELGFNEETTTLFSDRTQALQDIAGDSQGNKILEKLERLDAKVSKIKEIEVLSQPSISISVDGSQINTHWEPFAVAPPHLVPSFRPGSVNDNVKGNPVVCMDNATTTKRKGTITNNEKFNQLGKEIFEKLKKVGFVHSSQRALLTVVGYHDEANIGSKKPYTNASLAYRRGECVGEQLVDRIVNLLSKEHANLPHFVGSQSRLNDHFRQQFIISPWGATDLVSKKATISVNLIPNVVPFQKNNEDKTQVQ